MNFKQELLSSKIPYVLAFFFSQSLYGFRKLYIFEFDTDNQCSFIVWKSSMNILPNIFLWSTEDSSRHDSE